MRALLLATSLLGMISVTPVAAQNAGQPSSTTATFGNWLLRCRLIEASENQICEMTHTIQVAARDEKTGQVSQPQVLAQIAIGRLPGDDALKIVLQLPLAVALRHPVTIRTAASAEAFETDAAEPVVSPAYVYCQAGGCLADAVLAPETVDKLRSASHAQIGFTDMQGREIKLPLAMNGFADALTEMNEK